MDELRTVLREEVRKYAGFGLALVSYPLLDDENLTYGVIAIGDPRGKYVKREIVVVMARIDSDHIIIEVDNTDKQLVDALLQQGVPRDKIVLAYHGETLPDAVPSAGD